MTEQAPETETSKIAPEQLWRGEFSNEFDSGRDWQAENSLGNSITSGAKLATLSMAQLENGEAQFDFEEALKPENFLKLFNDQLETGIIETAGKEKLEAASDETKTDGAKGKSESILPGEIPKNRDELPFPLYGMDVPIKRLEEIRQEIRDQGSDPRKVVPELMKEVRVLGLGESHDTPNQQRLFGAEIMQKLKDNGATHLALEVPKEVQPDLDYFMKTGKLDRGNLPALSRDDQYFALLKAARAAGLRIVAVDRNEPAGGGGGGGGGGRGPGRASEGAEEGAEQLTDNAESDVKQELKNHLENADLELEEKSRDEVMADEISKILEADPKNKVVFWVGSLHLNRASGKSERKGAGELLAQKYKTATVMDQSDLQITDALAGITRDITKPTVIDTRDAKRMGELLTGPGPLEVRYRDWDYTIIYPQMKDKAGKPLRPPLFKTEPSRRSDQSKENLDEYGLPPAKAEEIWKR